MSYKRILFVFALNFTGEHDTLSSMAEKYFELARHLAFHAYY